METFCSRDEGKGSRNLDEVTHYVVLTQKSCVLSWHPCAEAKPAAAKAAAAGGDAKKEKKKVEVQERNLQHDEPTSDEWATVGLRARQLKTLMLKAPGFNPLMKRVSRLTAQKPYTHTT